MDRVITTNNKEYFLQAEYEDHFNVFFTSKEAYIEYLSDDAKACKECGAYYWLGCKKRCSCYSNEGIRPKAIMP